VKLYIGGKKPLPDSGTAWKYAVAMEACWENRLSAIAKTFAIAVAAARKADGWQERPTPARKCFNSSADNLSPRRDELHAALAAVVGEKRRLEKSILN